MAHTRSCEYARSPVGDCECSCGGAYHGRGVGRSRSRASSGPRASPGRPVPPRASPMDQPRPAPAPSPGLWATFKQARASRREAAEKARQERRRAAIERAKEQINDWLATTIVDFPAAGIAAAATNAAMEAVSNDIANAIMDALSRNGYSNPSRISHMLCDFLAAIACAMQTFRDQFQYHVADIVKTILKSRKKAGRPVIPGLVAAVAARAAVNVIMKLPPAHHFDDLLRAIRFLTISACPAPQDHEAVARCCLSPLEVWVLSDAIKQELRDELPRGWMPRHDDDG